jgi:cytochrome c-type biogenesis protein CcmH
MTPSIDALRHKLQQLQALHDSGDLSAQALADARAPIERELIAAVMQAEAPAAAVQASRPSRAMTLVLGSAVLLLALAGYALKGSPDLAWKSPGQTVTGSGAAAAGGDPPVTAEQVNEMVQKLADRLKEKPDDAVGWTMLARAYSAMGRYADAAPAFKKAVELSGEDAGLLADYADSLAASNNGSLAGEPTRLVEKALAMDPNNVKALALAGSVAFDARDYPTAVRHWEKVERALPADSQFVTQVRASIAQARELGGLPAAGPSGVMAKAAPAALPNAAAASSAPASPAAGVSALAKSVSGRVSLAPALAAQANPGDTVFILARAANGPRMPLAVLRKQVKDLPLSFTLDDSMAMAPTAKISDHAQVIVTARISKSGDALAKPGDLSGQSAPVAPGVSGIVIEITEVVPQ